MKRKIIFVFIIYFIFGKLVFAQVKEGTVLLPAKPSFYTKFGPSGEVRFGGKKETRSLASLSGNLSPTTTISLKHEYQTKRSQIYTKYKYNQNTFNAKITGMLPNSLDWELSETIKNRHYKDKSNPNFWENTIDFTLKKFFTNNLSAKLIEQFIKKKYINQSEQDYEENNLGIILKKLFGENLESQFEYRNKQKSYLAATSTYQENLFALKNKYSLSEKTSIDLQDEYVGRKYQNSLSANYRQNTLLLKTKYDFTEDSLFEVYGQSRRRNYPDVKSTNYKEDTLGTRLLYSFADYTYLELRGLQEKARYHRDKEYVSSTKNEAGLKFSHRFSYSTSSLLEEKYTQKKFPGVPDRSYKENDLTLTLRYRLGFATNFRVKGNMIDKKYFKEGTYTLNSRSLRYELVLKQNLGANFFAEAKYEWKKEKYRSDPTKNKISDLLTVELGYKF